MGLTRELGGFVAALSLDAVEPAVRRAVRRGIADCVGVMVAGRDEPVCGHALALIERRAAGGSTVLVDRGRAAPLDAAFVNSVAAHALDFDDTGLDGHPSVVLAPVLLAQAEAMGATWGEVVAAYVSGYEVWAELLGREADKLHDKGWHPTAVHGPLACAAATARLRRLDGARAAHALGIAASMAAGVVANFGSMTKPLQVGWAARNGMQAALLAERGVTAAADALENRRGFLAALSPAGRVRLDGAVTAGAPWQIERQGLSIKRFAVCYAVHRAVDAALSLWPAVAGRWRAIEQVEVTLGAVQAGMLRHPRPATPLDAKFSAEFAVACALARGQLGLADLGAERVCADDVQQLLQRVQVLTTDERDADDPLFSPADRLRVRMDDGRWLEAAPVRRARGHAVNPLSDAELRAKFDDCAAPGLGAAAAGRLWSALIDSGDDDLVDLAPPAP